MDSLDQSLRVEMERHREAICPFDAPPKIGDEVTFMAYGRTEIDHEKADLEWAGRVTLELVKPRMVFRRGLWWTVWRMRVVAIDEWWHDYEPLPSC